MGMEHLTDSDKTWARQIATSLRTQRIDCTPPAVLRLAAQYKRVDADDLERWADENEGQGL